MAEIQLTEMEKDTLAEIGNISMGSAATALSTLLNRRVEITTPRVSLTTLQEFEQGFDSQTVIVEVKYLQGLRGENFLILKGEDAGVIAGLMMGKTLAEAPKKLQELELSAIMEAMNQMVGSSATAMSDFFERQIDISPPEVKSVDLKEE
ncbi:MAG: flagellar motor switch phosphatase FliY, partial [Firmicutes bacterium]|nr:flagellar motor switch phosphatase FliY [Bacillota bacterium]